MLSTSRKPVNRERKARKERLETPRRDWSRAKLRAVALFFALAWVGLWFRAFQVQVLDGEELAELARRQHETSERLAGKRGHILDRSGALLATSVAVKSVAADPLKVEAPKATAKKLAAILGLKRSDLEKKFKEKSHFAWLERKVDDKTAARVEAAGLKGVFLRTEYARQYPNRRSAGQLLGFVGVDEEGLEGLERSFDQHLAGKVSKFLVHRDAWGRLIHLDGQGELREHLDGQDLRLTLDTQIQFMAEEILAKAVTDYKARWGGALMVDVASGDILAWAQYPFFNPNNRGSDSSLWRNRLVMDALEPGSTLKPFLVSAALENGVVTPESEYFCEEGKFKLGSFTIRDTHEYATLPVNQIVRYSSNICSAKIGLELGADRYRDFLVQVGLGQKTGLPLPGENTGILRPANQWQRIDLATASFGQSVSATVAQMAQAYLCIAAGGVMRPLRLVLDPAPEHPDERPAEHRVMSTRTAEQIRSMLTEVVEEDGTGTRARIPGLRVSGKTGTAQKASPQGGYGSKHTGSFVGFFPAENPEYLILVVIDEPHPQHYGGVVAAPAFQQLALRSLAYLGELPETQAQEQTLAEGQVVAPTAQETSQESYSAKVVQSEPLDRLRVPDLTGYPVRQAVEVLMRFGAKADIRGQGMVVAKQEPSPGRSWPEQPEPAVTIWLRPG